MENLFFEDITKEKLKNSGYYHLTIYNIKGILKKYQNLDFDYNETLDLDIIKEKLVDKFSVKCFNNFNKTTEISGKVESTIENFIELKTNTEIIETYINKFFRKANKINKQIITFNSKLAICKFHNIKLI